MGDFGGQAVVVFVFVTDGGAAAVGCGHGEQVAVGVVQVAGFAAERVALQNDATIVVAFGIGAAAVGIYRINMFTVMVEAVFGSATKYISNNSVPRTIVESPNPRRAGPKRPRRQPAPPAGQPHCRI